MECPNCKVELKMVKVLNYKGTQQHIDGKFHTFDVPDLELPHCSQCNQAFNTNVAEKKIKKAFKKYLKDNNITVYAEDIINTYLEGVPEQDHKAVRDVLCDMVFYNFKNLSFEQLRPFIQDLVALENTTLESPHDKYFQKYNQFATSFMKEEMIQLAQAYKKGHDVS